MVKKLFALASVTALTGLVAALGAAGCSTTTVEEQPGAGDAGDAGKPKKDKDAGGGGPSIDTDGGDVDPPEVPSKTVGKECTTDDECVPEDTDSQNFCSKGNFGSKGGNDVFPTPVCVGLCTPTTAAKPTIADFLCDGETGLCIPASKGQGLCLPTCGYDSNEVEACKGANNRCLPGLSAKEKEGAPSFGIGYCFGGCAKDADCVGTAGQKCQVEIGLCIASADYVTFTKGVGDGCDNAATTEECNCLPARGEGPDKDKGFCTHACITGTAGDAACGALKTGWKCNAGLDSDGDFPFTAQPPGLGGQCMLPCTTAADCTALGTTAGTVAECVAFAGGSFCDLKESKK